MTLATAEFIRRFLIHVLPHGFHRIRHYGLLASGTRADNIARARRLLDVQATQLRGQGMPTLPRPTSPSHSQHPCPCCGGRIRLSSRGSGMRLLAALPSSDFHTAVIRIDTS